LLLVFAAPLLVTSVLAQVKMEGTGPFKNLQVLKDTEVKSQMAAYARGLGVQCSRCHMPADYATDEVAAKVIARQMIIMTRDINEKHFGGANTVTCYTCHHGAAVPQMNPAP
jgi:photosynthetic reaction center cytochrome c subunit